MTRVVVAMPAYNEVRGIGGFLEEIALAFDDVELQIIVADDCSTDGTAHVVDDLAVNLPVAVLRGATNLGHGPTTLRALRAAVACGPDVVVAVDGDGQFTGSDLRRLADLVVIEPVDVVEGVRAGRDDPAFRRATSWVTRTLVYARAHVRPVDANTPLRAYRPVVLSRLLDVLPDDAMTPNLLISSLSRMWHLRVLEVPVASLPRRGGDALGSTWQARRRAVPSKRFVKFCLDATRQWVGVRVQRPPTAD